MGTRDFQASRTFGRRLSLLTVMENRNRLSTHYGSVCSKCFSECISSDEGRTIKSSSVVAENLHRLQTDAKPNAGEVLAHLLLGTYQKERRKKAQENASDFQIYLPITYDTLSVLKYQTILLLCTVSIHHSIFRNIL